MDPTPPLPAESLAVVVLAGGDGRRMGGRKPERTFGGTMLVARAVEAARRWSPAVAVAVRHPGQVPPSFDAPLILDPPQVGGPAAGLVSALAFARQVGATRLLTLPCDTPLLPDDLPVRLEAALTGSGARVAMAESLGRLHPTCALWALDVADALPDYLTQRASLRGFAQACGMIAVDWPCAPDADPFANANTPEELAALEARCRIGG